MFITKVRGIFCCVLILCIFARPCCAQPLPKATTPSITITNVIKPQNNTLILSKKFIVLDFWATWCAPCLASLPHLNNLQRSFNNNRNVVFLSLTDERPEKVRKIIKRFNFMSTVATDTTGATHKAFNVNAIPIIFLIDSDGKIRWSGGPDSLNLPLLKKLINKENVASDKMSMVKKSKKADSLYKSYRTIISDSLRSDFFSFSGPSNISSDLGGGSSGPKGFYKIQVGVKISELLAGLLHCGENQVLLPSNLLNKTVSYCIKRSGYFSEEDRAKILIGEMLTKLHLKLKPTVKKQNVYLLKITNALKLDSYKVKVKSNVSGTSTSDENKILAMYNSPIDAMLEQLKTALKTDVSLAHPISDENRYDVTLDNASFDRLQRSLDVYGLKLYAVKKVLPSYQISY